MAKSQGEQSSDSEGDKVRVFSGHSAVKGPKSFTRTSDESDEDTDE